MGPHKLIAGHTGRRNLALSMPGEQKQIGRPWSGQGLDDVEPARLGVGLHDQQAG
jgi:hypothetical protein